MPDIFAAAYWPFFKTPNVRTFEYTLDGVSGGQITRSFSYQAATDSMLWQEYDAQNVWQNTWHYQYRPGFGIAEWRDDYAGGKTTRFFTPIGWGNVHLIGGSYENTPIINPFLTTPLTLGIVGTQIVAFEALLDTFTLRNGATYKNVLVFLNQQTFGGKTGGVRFWMAEGLGPVAFEWVAPDPATGKYVITPRYDATTIIA